MDKRQLAQREEGEAMLYFFINSYKILLEKGFYVKSISQKVNFLLSDNWPDYMKFKSTAIQVLGILNDTSLGTHLHHYSDERLSPFWKNRYTALLVFQKSKISINKDFAKLFLNDSHRFVRLKAKQICL